MRRRARRHRLRSTIVLTTVSATLLLIGCTSDAGDRSGTDLASDGRTLEVEASDTACLVSSRTAPAGRLRIRVHNDGGHVMDFDVLDQEEERVVAAVEDIGPALTRDLLLTAVPGDYLLLCRRGNASEGVRTRLQVIHSIDEPTPPPEDEQAVRRAGSDYAAYVQDQANKLIRGTETFVALYTAGQDERARRRYAPTRQHWERIEVVADSFGTLSARIDQREADVPQDRPWTGWHRIEKDLWSPARNDRLSRAQRKDLGARLLGDTRELRRRLQNLTFDGGEIGATSLALTEAAARKVAGEEETWSHTDLWDIDANLDGAQAAYAVLRPALAGRHPTLDGQIASRFADVRDVLDRYRRGDGFVDYSTLTRAEIKALSDALHALSEPLSHLSAAMG